MILLKPITVRINISESQYLSLNASLIVPFSFTLNVRFSVFPWNSMHHRVSESQVGSEIMGRGTSKNLQKPLSIETSPGSFGHHTVLVFNCLICVLHNYYCICFIWFGLHTLQCTRKTKEPEKQKIIISNSSGEFKKVWNAIVRNCIKNFSHYWICF